MYREGRIHEQASPDIRQRFLGNCVDVVIGCRHHRLRNACGLHKYNTSEGINRSSQSFFTCKRPLIVEIAIPTNTKNGIVATITNAMSHPFQNAAKKSHCERRQLEKEVLHINSLPTARPAMHVVRFLVKFPSLSLMAFWKASLSSFKPCKTSGLSGWVFYGLQSTTKAPAHSATERAYLDQDADASIAIVPANFLTQDRREVRLSYEFSLAISCGRFIQSERTFHCFLDF